MLSFMMVLRRWMERYPSIKALALKDPVRGQVAVLVVQAKCTGREVLEKKSQIILTNVECVEEVFRAHDRVVHAKQSFDVSGTKYTATDLKKPTSTHKEQEKSHVSSRESEESIDNEISIDDKEVKRPEGQRGHMRESKVPFLTPRVISEDSMLLSKRETMDLPPEKQKAINDDKNFLSMVIRKSVDDLDVHTLKRGQYLMVVTKIKELVLNKNLDEGKIKKRVSNYICYKHKEEKKTRLG
ncbi:hypothetical protein KP79_PYT10966 [Mizuhopecten yessoensis]|uniref:Uncharacterized protein n=1 Tax=Mizuhopecten yessoensis TaxID=6573 RepID=A0A210PI22_MIZYE|nr:hypothetical protein KP79_PYT10966 [Mizuhopecten yessoensis]